jgi:hypothetical protein
VACFGVVGGTSRKLQGFGWMLLGAALCDGMGGDCRRGVKIKLLVYGFGQGDLGQVGVATTGGVWTVTRLRAMGCDDAAGRRVELESEDQWRAQGPACWCKWLMGCGSRWGARARSMDSPRLEPRNWVQATLQVAEMGSGGFAHSSRNRANTPPPSSTRQA